MGGRLWLVAQSFGDMGKPDLWDVPTPAEMRLMINLALARGTRGLTYFCYDSSPRAKEWLEGLAVWPFVPANELYHEVGRINRRVASLAPTITDLRWVEEAGQPAQRFDVQLLVDGAGQPYAWITNLDTQHAAEGTITMGAEYEPVSVELAPGDGVLVRLSQSPKQ